MKNFIALIKRNQKSSRHYLFKFSSLKQKNMQNMIFFPQAKKIKRLVFFKNETNIFFGDNTEYSS